MPVSYDSRKLVKLTNQERKIKADLKAAIDNQTPEETLADWQNSLKKYDAGLETVFDQAKWKEKKSGQAKFDNLAALETLLKKVCEVKTDGTIEKVEEEFIAALKKIDANIDTLGKKLNLLTGNLKKVYVNALNKFESSLLRYYNEGPESLNDLLLIFNYQW